MMDLQALCVFVYCCVLIVVVEDKGSSAWFLLAATENSVAQRCLFFIFLMLWVVMCTSGCKVVGGVQICGISMPKKVYVKPTA